MSRMEIPMPPELAAKLLGAIANGVDQDKSSKPLPIQARVLKDMFDEVRRPCPFAPGDLVQQIPEYTRYRFPIDGDLGLVMETGTFEEGPEGGDAVAKNDMRILVAVSSPRGAEWAQFDVESWRFKKYEGAIDG